MRDISLAAREIYFSELARQKQSLEPVAAVSCTSFPGAVLAGLGLRPVRYPLELNPCKTSCSPGREDICPLVEQLLQGLNDLHPSVIIGLYTCDMTRRFFQESPRFLNHPVYQLQLPSTSGENAAAFYAEQVERVCSDIILGGFSTEYNPEKAMEWFQGTVVVMELLKSISLSVPPVALQYFYHMMRILSPWQVESIIKSLTGSHPAFESRFRLVLAGSPGIPGDDTVASVVEEAGGCLIPVNCSGQAGFPENTPDSFSPADLGRLYFHAGRCIRRRPNDAVFDLIANAVTRYMASGVLLRTLPFCDLWYTEKVRIKDRLPVRVQVLNAGFSPGEKERTAVRIEAFIQILEVGQ